MRTYHLKARKPGAVFYGGYDPAEGRHVLVERDQAVRYPNQVAAVEARRHVPGAHHAFEIVYVRHPTRTPDEIAARVAARRVARRADR